MSRHNYNLIQANLVLLFLLLSFMVSPAMAQFGGGGFPFEQFFNAGGGNRRKQNKPPSIQEMYYDSKYNKHDFIGK